MRHWSLILLSSGVFAVPACTSTTRGVQGEDGCTAGEVRCQGDELQQCDADGVAFEVKTECVPGTCVDGQTSCPDANGSGGSSGDGGVGGDANGISTTSGGSNGDGGTSGGSNGDGGTSGDTTTSGGSSGDGGTGGDTTTSGGSSGDGGTGGETTTTGGTGGDGGAGGMTMTATVTATATTTSSGGIGGDGGSSGATSTTAPVLFCSPNPCPSDRRCDEDADACVCDGCLIGDSCVDANSLNGSNSCEICDPDRSTNDYSPDTGADCGSSETECSGQDTCNSSADCRPNHVADRTECSDGYCEGGVCTVPVFDCIAPSPPVIDIDEIDIISASGSPPSPTGGTVQDGRYTPIRMDYYGDQPTTINIYSFEFDGIFVQASEQPYPPWVPAWSFAGIFTRVDDTLEFDLQQCEAANVELPVLEYSMTANGMLTFETYSNGTRVMISYLRE